MGGWHALSLGVSSGGIPFIKIIAIDLSKASNRFVKVNTMRKDSLAHQPDWTRLRGVLRGLRLGASLFLICPPGFSQGAAGRILGVVADQSGSVIASATVTITDTQRGISRVLITDNVGEYDAPNLLPSIYMVQAE